MSVALASVFIKNAAMKHPQHLHTSRQSTHMFPEADHAAPMNGWIHCKKESHVCEKNNHSTACILVELQVTQFTLGLWQKARVI